MRGENVRHVLIPSASAFLIFVSLILSPGFVAAGTINSHHTSEQAITPGNGQLIVTWNANSKPVDGYKVYWGTESRNYTNSVDVGNATTYTITGLTNGKKYYVSVTAYADIKETYFYHTDHLGTPLMMTDKNGNKVWEGEFLPFGEQYHITGSVINNLRFPGQYYDKETGLHQNYFRDYDPKRGTYQQRDPIGLLGGINPYSYVLSNPLNRIDPYGLLDSVTAAALAAGNLVEAAAILEEACVSVSTKAAMAAALAKANKIHHIFDNIGHNLEYLVTKYGGQAQAYDALLEGANKVASQLGSPGVTTITVNVGGQNVTVTGNIVNGVIQIGTAYVKQ